MKKIFFKKMNQEKTGKNAPVHSNSLFTKLVKFTIKVMKL